MIEILLVCADGSAVDEVSFGEPASTTFDSTGTDISMLRFRRLENFPEPRSKRVCVRVRVTDTALSRKHLHEWIELTLNQALITWIIERGIERSSRKTSNRLQDTMKSTKTASVDTDTRSPLEKLCPGLPSLYHMLLTSHELPHPAVSRVVNHGVIRSSTVSTKTLEMLQTCIFGNLFKDAATAEAARGARPNLAIIRISRSALPELVKLSWDPLRRTAIAHATDSLVDDSPIDCPEYVCFFELNQFGEQEYDIDPHLRLYREVMIHDGISDRSSSIELLESLKAQNLNAFRRSFAFVFSVKRNQRTLLAYNWNPNLVKT